MIRYLVGEMGEISGLICVVGDKNGPGAPRTRWRVCFIRDDLGDNGLRLCCCISRQSPDMHVRNGIIPINSDVLVIRSGFAKKWINQTKQGRNNCRCVRAFVVFKIVRSITEE